MSGESFRKAPEEVLETFRNVGICPDCDSSMELRQMSEFVFILEIAHSPSCPWLGQHGGDDA